MKKHPHPLRVYRESCVPPLTQTQLADILGVTQSHIAKIESRDQGITPDRARDWEEKIGVPKEVLCFDEPYEVAA